MNQLPKFFLIIFVFIIFIDIGFLLDIIRLLRLFLWVLLLLWLFLQLYMLFIIKRSIIYCLIILLFNDGCILSEIGSIIHSWNHLIAGTTYLTVFRFNISLRRWRRNIWISKRISIANILILLLIYRVNISFVIDCHSSSGTVVLNRILHRL